MHRRRGYLPPKRKARDGRAKNTCGGLAQGGLEVGGGAEAVGACPPPPTQKPLELMEYFIKAYTDQGQTVLDFRGGVGQNFFAHASMGMLKRWAAR